ncbi:MAG: OsmC family protein [Polyangiales bacterium]
MSDPVSEFSLRIERVDGYEFRVRFDKEHYAELSMDEPPPLGRDSAPNPARMLAAAVGNCLAASLLFCMNRARRPLDSVTADVKVELVRNEAKRLRIGRVAVVLRPQVEGGAEALAPCLETFEDFCVVTQSVREGLQVDVTVEPV